MALPVIIQGGMGAGVSTWTLAQAVSRAGQMGVVSGIALEVILAWKLQSGDEGGELRRALAAFPDPHVAERILAKYPVASSGVGGRLRLPPPHTLEEPEELTRETIAAAFVQVYLAKQGHSHPVGINLLTKIQLPILASLYGAMLAGVDYVIMGAGIPRQIPLILDRLAAHEDVDMDLQVEGARAGEVYRVCLSPRRLLRTRPGPLVRPKFFPIVSSNALAVTMVRKSSGRVDGLVVENSLAGGHNAPPRGPLILNSQSEPAYGLRDQVDVKRIADLGVPFYLAGGYGRPEGLEYALAVGAQGVQVGSLFALCRESGLAAALKETAILRIARNLNRVITDAFASPTGYPFKLFDLEGTLADLGEYLRRPRVCDFGFLRRLYRRDDGGIGYRCPAEPERDWLAKGGAVEELQGRRCLCNALLANLGLARQRAGGYLEKPLLTLGASLDQVRQFIAKVGSDYSASDVINYLLGNAQTQPA